MTDQTPVTDDDLRKARQWAMDTIAEAEAEDRHLGYHHAACVILATVPAPPVTLADELRELNKGDIPLGALLELADRVEAVEKARDKAQQDAVDAWEHAAQTAREHVRIMELREQDYVRVASERDEAQHELDETRADLRDVTNLLDQARAEVERLTVSLNRQCTTVTPSVHNTDALPDPADVPTGEPWFVRDDWGLCIGSRRDEGFQSWTLVRVRTGGLRFRADPDVTLIRPVDISDINPEETA